MKTENAKNALISRSVTKWRQLQQKGHQIRALHAKMVTFSVNIGDSSYQEHRSRRRSI